LEGYDLMQVCLNGHMITAHANLHYSFRKAFCPGCGSETILACTKCSAGIQGTYHWPPGKGISRSPKNPPAFCHGCGHPYPWTEARQQALAELVDDADGMAEDDKQRLREALRDIQTDGPRTEVGAGRLKKIIKQGALTVGSGLYKVALDVATDAAKKLIVGN
jgi:hypothetical protein